LLAPLDPDVLLELLPNRSDRFYLLVGIAPKLLSIPPADPNAMQATQDSD
jgi:hypothetical protein